MVGGGAATGADTKVAWFGVGAKEKRRMVEVHFRSARSSSRTLRNFFAAFAVKSSKNPFTAKGAKR